MSFAKPRTSVGRIAAIAVANLLVFGLSVAALEFAAALFTQKPADYTESHWRFNHTWKPNGEQLHSEFIGDNPDFPDPYLHVYNAQGWIEDYDIELEKPAGTFRIFYVGDSFTEGTVPMDESVPSRVEGALNELAGDGPRRFEVINTGTGSYSTLIYYLLIRYAILDYSPDLIVVNVDMSDNYDDWSYAESMVLDENGDPFAAPPRNIYSSPFLEVEGGELVEANPWNRLQLYLYANSYAYNLILEKFPPRRHFEEEVEFASLERWPWCKPTLDEKAKEQLEFTLGLVRKIAGLCLENGVKLMLTGVPHYPQYHGSDRGRGRPRMSNRPHDELQRVSVEEGTPFLNSYEVLKPLIEGTRRTRYYHSPDIHFNPRGYEIWADAQLEFLLDPRNGLLPRFGS